MEHYLHGMLVNAIAMLNSTIDHGMLVNAATGQAVGGLQMDDSGYVTGPLQEAANVSNHP